MIYILNSESQELLKHIKKISLDKNGNNKVLTSPILSLDALLTLCLPKKKSEKISFPVIKNNYWLCLFSILDQIEAKNHLKEVVEIFTKRHLLKEDRKNKKSTSQFDFSNLNAFNVSIPKISPFTAFRTLVSCFKYYILDLDIPLSLDHTMACLLVQFLLEAETSPLLSNNFITAKEFILDLIFSWNSDLYSSSSWEMGFKSVHTRVTGIHKVVTVIDAFVESANRYQPNYDFLTIDERAQNDEQRVLLLYLIAKYYSLPFNQVRQVSHLRVLHKKPWSSGLNACIHNPILNKHLLYLFHSAVFNCLPEFFEISYSFKGIKPNFLPKDSEELEKVLEKYAEHAPNANICELGRNYSDEPLLFVSRTIDYTIERFISDSQIDENYLALCQNPVNLLQWMKDTAICSYFSLGLLQPTIKVLMCKLNDFLSKGSKANESISQAIKQNISQQNIYSLQECAIMILLADLAVKHEKENCSLCSGITPKLGYAMNEIVKSPSGLTNIISFGFDKLLIKQCVEANWSPDKLLEPVMQLLANKIKGVTHTNFSSAVFCYKIAVALVLSIDRATPLVTQQKEKPEMHLSYYAETLSIYFLESLKTALTINISHSMFVVAVTGPVSRIYYKFPKLAQIASVVVNHYIPNVSPDQEMLLKSLNDLSMTLLAIVEANAIT